MKSNANLIKYNLNLTEKLHYRFKVHCAIEGKDMSEVVRKLIEEYLEKAEKRRRPASGSEAIARSRDR
jgi:metal-responsive CopG/Arc/MetJ family transcriptional regulator